MSADDAGRYAAQVERAVRSAFEAHADPRRAAAMSAYMRDQFSFLGIPTPDRDSLSRPIMARLRPSDEAGLACAASRCWALPEREYQYFAVRLLRRHVKLLSGRSLPMLEQLISTRPWWDTVDELASNVVGPLLAGHPELRQVTEKWIGHDDIWLARTAILHQLRYRQDTDATTLFDFCRRRAADREFFLQKAIGWALREYSKTDPREVRRFVNDNYDSLAPLSRREALRLIEPR